MLDMNHFMKDIQKLQNLVDEISSERDRLQEKMLIDGNMTEKEQIQFELLEHLMDTMR